MSIRYALGFLLLLAGAWPTSAGVRSATGAGTLTHFDSLWANFRSPGLSGKKRVDILLVIEYDLLDQNPDSALIVAQQARALSRKIGYAYGEVMALNALAMNANRRADYQGSMRYLTEAVARARATGEKRGLSQSYDRLADVAFAQQDFRRAARLAKLSLDVAVENGEPEPLGALSSLMSAYLELGRVAEARPLLRRLQRLAQHDPIDGKLAEYQAMAAWANGIRKTSLDTAAYYGEAALEKAHQMGNEPAESYSLMSLMQTYAAAKNWAAVVRVAPREFELLRRYPNPAYEAEVELAYADALHALQPTNPAAFRALRHALILNDTLFGQEQSAALAAARVKFDVAGQQARIRDLEQQRRIQRLQTEQQAVRSRILVGVATGLAGLLLIGSWFYRRLRAQRAALAESEARLRQANATKDQLMAVVGHDLRGPAAALRVVAPLLRELKVDQADPSGEVGEVLTGLDAGTQELSALLDTLLHWAREQTGALEVRRRSLVIAQVLAEATAPYFAQAAIAGVKLDRQPVPMPGVLHSDPDLLLTILRNLVANAVKFTPPGGRVALAAKPETTHGQLGVLFTVTDTGPGLDPNQARQLLASDAPTTGARGEAGTGLGLPLSARFAALLGGELRVMASGPNGTTLGCWLPTGQP